MKLLIAGLILVAIASIALAETEITIDASSIFLINEENEVYILAKNLTQFNAGDYTIHFNNSLLDIVSIYNGSVNGVDIPVSYAIKNGSIKIINNLDNLQSVSGDGYLCIIKVIGKNNGKVQISIDGNLSNVNGEKIEAIWKGKEIVITSTVLKLEASEVVKDDFEVYLQIFNVSDFGALNLTILFDKNYLFLDGVEAGNIGGENLTIYWKENKNGLNIVALGNGSGNGYIAKLSFSPLNLGRTYINITNVSISNSFAQPIYAYIENASILLSSKLPPFSNFTWSPSMPYAFQNITFNASSSYDIDGFITNYTWDFDGNGIIDAITDNPVIIYSYSNDGIYNVTLTVYDNDGFNSTITKQITILNNPPIANFSFMPINPKTNENITFNASLSYDIDGFITNYTWDFGDGSIGYGKIVQHSYSNDGIYNVTLTIYDDDGSIATVTKSIEIRKNNPPNKPVAVYPENNATDIPLEFDLAWSCSDVDGDKLTYDVYFGTELTKIAENITNTTFHVSNLQQSTTYYWRIVAWDEYGAKNSSQIWKFTTQKINIKPTCSLKASPNEGEMPLTVTFYISASDEDGYIASWKLDINNDGFAEYTGIDVPATITHTYNSAGRYTAKLIVKDNEGAESTAIAYITVLSPYTPNILPTVQITSPLNGSVVKGEILIEGTAGDEDGSIVKVEIRIDKEEWKIANGTNSWNYKLDTTKLSNGFHTIEARAYDGIDYSNTAKITINVSNVINTPPEIEILSPANGSIVNGFIIIKGNAWDKDGNDSLVKVEIRIDGMEWKIANGTINWEYSIDTTKLSNGLHIIEARAYDGMAYSQIAKITINVQNEKEKKSFSWLPIVAIVIMAVGVAIWFIRKK